MKKKRVEIEQHQLNSLKWNVTGKTWIFNDGNRSPRTRTTTEGIAFAFWTASSKFQRSCGANTPLGDVLGTVPGEGDT